MCRVFNNCIFLEIIAKATNRIWVQNRPVFIFIQSIMIFIWHVLYLSKQSSYFIESKFDYIFVIVLTNQ